MRCFSCIKSRSACSCICLTLSRVIQDNTVYVSGEFVGIRDMQQDRLLRMLAGSHGKSVNFCHELQVALQEMFPMDLGSGKWLPWLHVEEWTDPMSCLAVL